MSSYALTLKQPSQSIPRNVVWVSQEELGDICILRSRTAHLEGLDSDVQYLVRTVVLPLFHLQ